jgi:hypothetical protein
MKEKTARANAACKIRRRMNKNLVFLTVILAVTLVATIGQNFVIQ